jgi:hypothetical protein
MQQWARQTTDDVTSLQSTVGNLKAQLAAAPQRDKTVYTKGADVVYTTSGDTVTVAPDGGVKFVNSTRLVQVTVSAVLVATNGGAVGVGFTLDGADPSTAMSGIFITQGIQIKDGANVGAYSGMTFTATLPVTPGVHTAALFYYNHNPGTGSPSTRIWSPTITVTSV